MKNGGQNKACIVYDPITYPALKVLLTPYRSKNKMGCVPVPNTALLNRTPSTGSAR
jgi:hypothetical protein